MYSWQLNSSFTKPLISGEKVWLNPQWSGFNYLKQEFGKFFPNSVREIHDDIIVVDKLRFARQVLTNEPQR